MDTNEGTEMKTVERGSQRPMKTRRDLPKHAGIEIRDHSDETHDVMRGGAGNAARHGDVLAGGVPDEGRRQIVVESTGNSGPNAGKVLHSDSVSSGETIRGGRPSSDIAREQRARINADAYERKGPTARRDLTDEQRLEALRRRVPESMVSEEGGVAIEVIGAQREKAQQSEAERAAEVRAKLTRRR